MWTPTRRGRPTCRITQPNSTPYLPGVGVASVSPKSKISVPDAGTVMPWVSINRPASAMAANRRDASNV